MVDRYNSSSRRRSRHVYMVRLDGHQPKYSIAAIATAIPMAIAAAIIFPGDGGCLTQ